MTEVNGVLDFVVEKLGYSSELVKLQTRGKSPCDTCTLRGRNKIMYDGDLETAKVMFIGEAPGKSEDSYLQNKDKDDPSKLFIGKSGQFLRKIIKDAEIKPEEVVYTNVCRCYPPNGRTPDKKEISRCLKFLKADIEKFNGELLVLLGGTALQAILGKSGLLNNRGYGFMEFGRHVFVTYHPAYVLRNSGTVIEDVFKDDIRKVKKFLDSTKEVVHNEDIIYSIEDADNMIKYLEQQEGELDISFDLETTGLDSKIEDVLSIAFSQGNRNWFIPLEHVQSPFFGKSEQIMEKIAYIFTDKKYKLIGQNAKFDIKFLKARYGITVENLSFDTMIAHYLLVGKYITHSLKPMVWRYTDFGGYGIDRTTLEDTEIDDLASYNVMDAKMTLELQKLFIKKMPIEALTLMNKTIVPAIQAIAEMELEGVLLDTDILEEMLEKYITEVTAIEQKMLEYPVIKYYVKKQGKSFNFSSVKQLREILELLKIDTGKVSKKTGAMKADEKALKGVEKKHGLIADILEFRKKNKILTTYLKPYVEKNIGGRIFADYSFTTTATGRLSSYKPNFQNIPYDTRPVFISNNGLFLEFDYSQLELRVLAMLAKDEPMIKSFIAGEDIHEQTRFIIFGDNTDKSDSVKKEQRVQAKSVNFAMIYGANYTTLAKELKKSEKVAKKWIEDWYNAHPAVTRFQNAVWEYVKQNGYVDTPFGRVRYFNLNKPGMTQGQLNAAYREAINMPIQSTASDLVLTGLGGLWNWKKEENLTSKMVWEVHDSIGIDCFENELETIILKGKMILEGLNFEWMQDVPLTISCSVGKHWGKMEEV